MTTDEIYAAARAEMCSLLDIQSAVRLGDDGAEWLAQFLHRGVVDAVAPLLIAQGRREAAQAIRTAATDEDRMSGWWRSAGQIARIAEGGTP